MLLVVNSWGFFEIDSDGAVQAVKFVVPLYPVGLPPWLKKQGKQKKHEETKTRKKV